MTSAGVVSSVLYLIPVAIILINLLGIVFHHPEKESKDIPLRFLILGVYSFLVLGVVSAFSTWPDISGVVRFTGVSEATTQLWMLGAISFPLFGALYNALPPLLGRDCWCNALADKHYWLTIAGFWSLIGFLILEGLVTGLALSDPAVSFLNITSYAYPFHALEVASELILFIASLIFAINLFGALAGDYFFPKR
jgi:cytochrome c oxidase cbb3-type subunit 1